MRTVKPLTKTMPCPRFVLIAHSLRRSVCFSAALLAAPVLPAAEPPAPAPSLVEVWRLVGQGLPGEAWETLAALDAIPSSAGEAPARALARGVLLLEKQPRTQNNLKTAQIELESAMKTPPAGAADTATAAMASYYLARLYDLHAFERDADRALALYRTLADQPEPTLWKNLAQVKVVLLEANALRPGPEAAAAFAALEARAAIAADPAAQREIHLLLGLAAQHLALPPEVALRHLSAGLALGIERSADRADVLARVAGLTAHVKGEDAARPLFARFASEFPRDSRAAMLRARSVAPATR